MQIKILKANRYNNADRSAIDCAEGDILETSAAYAGVLVADGLAEYVEVEKPAQDENRQPQTFNRKTKAENRQPQTFNRKTKAENRQPQTFNPFIC
jgi:hypothetical protein